MPYEWITPAAEPDARQPVAELHLWPYRSLPRKGFVAFIGITAGLLSLPLLALLGSPILWGLLPFMALVIGAVWWALNRSYRDGEVVEELRFWPDRITLTQHNPRGGPKEWEANPYWVTVHIHEKDGPVPHYLTLRGGDREVELGAFLSEAERIALRHEVQRRLTDLR